MNEYGALTTIPSFGGLKAHIRPVKFSIDTTHRETMLYAMPLEWNFSPTAGAFMQVETPEVMFYNGSWPGNPLHSSCLGVRIDFRNAEDPSSLVSLVALEDADIYVARILVADNKR